MSRRIPITVSLALATAAAAVWAEPGGPPATRPASAPATRVAVDRESFTLTATPPPVPALKYAFVVDPVDREPGDAAPLYYQAALLVPGYVDQAATDRAWDDHQAGKSLAADAGVAALLEKARPVLDLVRLAARQERCEWDVPARQFGVRTMLAQLNTLRGAANLVQTWGWQRADAGDVAGAVEAIRVQETLGRQAGRGMLLVGGLVGVGITAVADDMARSMMSRPDCPNLYWSLVDLPRPSANLRAAMDGEAQMMAAQFPPLAKARRGGLTAAGWPLLLHGLVDWQPGFGGTKPPMIASTAIESDPHRWPRWAAAARYYGRTRGLPASDVVAVDPGLVLATYLVEQYQAVADERDKLMSLPYPQLLPRLAVLPERLAGLGIDAANEIDGGLDLGRVLHTFAQNDRTRSALTAVEALRSYAADHGGRLPDRLEDVSETPVPDNPVTGRPFEYRLDGEVATLGDHSPLLADRPLEYTVRIRKP